MPVDYSKWDALELSDDSDIEVHPNVDKKSFIQAKQNQIHQQRFERKHRITTLQYERVVNDGLLARIDALLKSLDAHKAEATGDKSQDEIDEVVFDALTDVTTDGSLGNDQPPTPPANVHTKEQQPAYSKMMGTLIDQVKSEVDKTKEPSQRYGAYITEILGHRFKVQGLQDDLNVELSKLEKEEGSKITSESIHEGFNSSHLAKSDPSPAAKTGASTTEPELLNAGAVGSASNGAAKKSSVDDDDDIEASPTAKRFAKLPHYDYAASLQFIGKHPEIMVERETDGLLVEAFNAQSNAKSPKDEDYARHCVHQALLLQYCRQLGKDGVGLFFKRIQTPNHQARKLFIDDVNSTYARIKTRTAELAKMKDEEDTGDREQIQLHAVDPGTSINIVTPPPREKCTNEDEHAARDIFDALSPDLQKALETGELDKVNKVLGDMSVADAELVVEQLGTGGMLSLESGVIDATTEEGRKQVEELEKSRKGAVTEIDEVEELEQPIEEKLSVDEVD